MNSNRISVRDDAFSLQLIKQADGFIIIFFKIDIRFQILLIACPECWRDTTISLHTSESLEDREDCGFHVDGHVDGFAETEVARDRAVHVKEHVEIRKTSDLQYVDGLHRHEARNVRGWHVICDLNSAGFELKHHNR